MLFETVKDDNPLNPKSSEDVLADLANTSAFTAFLFFNSFLTAGLLQESAKVFFLRGSCSACCKQNPEANPRRAAYLTVTLLSAASLGLALADSMWTTVWSGFLVDGRDQQLVMEAMLIMIVHCLCAGFTGLRLSIRDLQIRQRDARMYSSSATPHYITLPSGVTVLVMGVESGGARGEGEAPGAVQPSQAPPPPQLEVPTQEEPAIVGVVSMSHPSSPPNLSSNNPQHSQQMYSTWTPNPDLIEREPLREPSAENSTRLHQQQQQQQQQQQAPVALWSFSRVLWPAILISGLYSFCVSVISVSNNASIAIALDIFLCLLLLLLAGGVLYAQYSAVFDIVCAGGRIPERLTFAPVWWPEAYRGRCISIMTSCFGRRVILQGQSASSVYNPVEEGYQALPAGPLGP